MGVAGREPKSHTAGKEGARVIWVGLDARFCCSEAFVACVREIPFPPCRPPWRLCSNYDSVMGFHKKDDGKLQHLHLHTLLSLGAINTYANSFLASKVGSCFRKANFPCAHMPFKWVVS